MKKIRIGSGAGYAGDRIEPAVELMEKWNLDYIIFECLAERTVAIGQQDKEKDPSKGYNQLLDYRMEKILPLMAKNKVKVIEMNGESKLQKAKERIPDSGSLFSPPESVAVQTYFLDLKSTEIEAEKFYNYFQSNGWKVGGKAPMKDWQAAARNWVLNAPAFAKPQKVSADNQPTPGQLNTTGTKNYSAPL